MFAKPQSEHRWLDQLLGTWNFEHRCRMPDGTESMTPGKMICRSLGGLWLIAESSGHHDTGNSDTGNSDTGNSDTGPSDDGGHWSAVMTLGFDPAQNQYVGTFVGSMMTHIWPYAGNVDESGKRLPLASRGPKFDGSGQGEYRDTIEIVDANTWILSSETLSDDGQWVKFMEGKHVRSNG